MWRKTYSGLQEGAFQRSPELVRGCCSRQCAKSAFEGERGALGTGGIWENKKDE